MIGALALVVAAAAPAQEAPNSGLSFYAAPYYAVFFKETVEGGELKEFVVQRVIDPARSVDNPVDVAVPPAFVDAVKRRLIASKPPAGTGFLYAYLDPTNPTNADFDPKSLSAPIATLTPQQSVTVRQDARGWLIVKRQSAGDVPVAYPLVAGMREMARGLNPNGGVLPPRKAGDPPERVDPTQGEVRLTLRVDPKRHSSLIVENGTDRLFTYRAAMSINGDAAKPTTVCAGKPGIGVLEHWNGPIERLDLADFALLPPDAPVPCR